MSDLEVARARHSETEETFSVFLDGIGRLRAEPCTSDAATFVGELPDEAGDPTVAGTWRHFKGGIYEFLTLVRSPSGDMLLLYLDSDGRPWLRPWEMVQEVIERDGRRVARFARADD